MFFAELLRFYFLAMLIRGVLRMDFFFSHQHEIFALFFRSHAKLFITKLMLLHETSVCPRDHSSTYAQNMAISINASCYPSLLSITEKKKHLKKRKNGIEEKPDFMRLVTVAAWEE